MLAKDLIDRLERLGLLDQEIIEALREQLAQSGARVTPEAVAKLLVDNGQLTRFQATKLIGELRNSEYSDPDEDAALVDPAGDELALLEGDDSFAEAVEVVEVADQVASDVNVVPSGYRPGSAVAAPVGDDAMMDSAAGLASSRPKKVNVGKKVRDPSRSIWDSFKIYGVAATILILLFFGAVLYFVLSKGSADEFIELANGQYSKQNYEAARDSYAAFLTQFGEANPHSSIARTRRAMSELYVFEQGLDPTRATKEAEILLPKIESEPGLEEERNNLAALLVEIADNIAQAAGAAKETREKQKLLTDLDGQIKLI
ncbi:MAG: serine/threonine protein kinase, partial [Planctomycetaceae bacterium]